MNKVYLPVIYFTLIASLSFAEKNSSTKEVDKQEKKIQNIILVLKFGSIEQIKRAIVHIPHIKEEEQKKMIPLLKNVFKLSDETLTTKLLQLLSEVKWNDLDNKVTLFLDSPSNSIFFTTLELIKKKKIISTLDKIKTIIKELDYTKITNKLADLLNLLAFFKDTQLSHFLFNKIQDTDTIKDNIKRIFTYLIKTKYSTEDYRKYLRTLLNKEDLGFKIIATKNLGVLKDNNSKVKIKEEFLKIRKMKTPEERRKYNKLYLAALTALIQLKEKEVEKYLLDMARSDLVSSRLVAIKHLSEVDVATYKDILEYKAEYDPSSRVRKLAKEILDSYKNKKSDSKIKNTVSLEDQL